jgi:putative ABC transport system ATP-binding protein
MAMHPAIEVRQLTKTYAEGNTGTLALRGVDLNVHAGELLMLMGPSGSGKTTLLSIMGCILTASSGSVRIAGKEITHLTEKYLPGIRLEHIGFVFQGFNLFPTLSAGENVELMLDLKGADAKSAKKRAAELLDQVGLGGQYGSFPSDLSGGQKQRIAIVLVTHDSRVLSFADRIVKIEDGAIARPEALRREPVPAGMLTHTFSQSTLNID